MSQYSAAGVDIAAATRAKELMAAAVRSTHGPAVLAGMGAFGGCFDAALALAGIQAPVLVSSTDGVGTKTLVAAAVGRYDTVGQDLVHHAVNDILVQGARPLFFLDYIAVAKLDPVQVAAIVAGVAEGCRATGCALIGGETAEMPDVYAPGAFDLAGTIVGVVERSAMLPRTDIIAGDAIVALPSTGLHTNGYSLARRLVKHHFATEGYAARPAMLGGQTIGDALLAVHRCYLSEVIALRAVVPVKALCHITGGGIYDNLPRVLPAGLGAEIVRGSWSIPPICQLLVELGRLDEQEAFHTLNMGLGMLVIVPAEMVNQALATIPEARLVGRVTAGPTVRLVDA
ncbi:phosphoribosylformylglycinamidine cyclo-ligase [Chloroflexus sp. MS-CIW-1]|jgi:phosphoribosylformylglycinamidine cyclo-ligase|uniref:phosphoribosylformylglycinamidine cyclo-ligase n=1 Tax=Chloroflexus sp. MS-CIW-1 TaxID=3055768 RepID=UPI001B2266E0|nr:phosphoribosylformylglycinamidine cyclo-ligase [Chloroflexus sp. MS-CIW-1]MBO9317977.1 phosphoribosylformylglycinamidine cyclo-ligase [Chloroflexus sp.]MBO9337480.1 phosphoribosylformylglycinamidine cyclo-ligase [Chloroflexus sp.]MBO9349536.1 phosphoribosylformylglycinamidine cyclo-ligase [Chloroflexus sp.]MDN5271312.1 phosphoribosylformylglycinamidine cyclo-ligase [Chloroflexus sp. MS-CIW-1]